MSEIAYQRVLQTAKFAYLVLEEPSLHLKVGTDMLVDCPCKLIIQLPGFEAQYYTEKSDNTWHSDEVWSNVGP